MSFFNSTEVKPIKKKRKRKQNIWNKILSEKEFNEIGKLDHFLDSNSYEQYLINKRYFVLRKRIEKGRMIRNNTSMRFSNSQKEFFDLCKQNNLPNPWLNQ